jgi:hypothetical protein
MLNRRTPSPFLFRCRGRRVSPAANNRKLRPKLTCRPKPERIGDESPTVLVSPSVHDNIWWAEFNRRARCGSIADAPFRLVVLALSFGEADLDAINVRMVNGSAPIK